MVITTLLCPESQYSLKCPNITDKKMIVIHNTANSAPAMNEVSYMVGNSSSTSFHAAVDEKQVVVGIPENRNTWHCGDGPNGYGNLYGYSIEICRSLYDSDIDLFKKAEQNAAEYVAYLLNKWGWGVDKVTKHQDYNGKYCPHRTLDLGWARFIAMIQKELDNIEPAVVSTGDYSVLTSVSGYKTAEDAKKKNNPVNIKAKGLYFVYKEVDGAVNISSSKTSPGAWINSEDNKVQTKSQSIASAVPSRSTSKQFTIGESVRVETWLWLNDDYREDIRQGVRVAEPGEFFKILEFAGDWGKAYDPVSKRQVWFNLKYCR